MKLLLKRIAKKSAYTIGRLFIDGQRFCDTLEDTDRGLSSSQTLDYIRNHKLYGETAIPTGTYEIDMSIVSSKFMGRTWAKPYGGKIPRLKDVPGFGGVLIHPGSVPADTLGCVLVGKNTVKGMVTSSQLTFKELMDKYLVPASKRNEKITLTIE